MDMNTKKKKMTAGKGSNAAAAANDAASSSASPPSAAAVAASSTKKKGSNSHDSRQPNSNEKTDCGGQKRSSGSSSRLSHLSPASPHPSHPSSSGQHSKPPQPAHSPNSASMRHRPSGGQEPGHGAGTGVRRNVEAEDLPIDCSFARRRHHLSPGCTTGSDDVVNTAFNNKLYHVRDPDDGISANGLDVSLVDSNWVSVPTQRSSLRHNSPSQSSRTTSCSSGSHNDTGSGSLSLSSPASQPLPPETQPIRVPAPAAHQSPQQQLQPPHAPAAIQAQPATAKPSERKPHMDREERVKSLAKQANLLIDEGIPMQTKDDEDNIRDAINLLDVAIRIDANDYRLFINRGYCYEILSQYDRALDDADKAVAIRSDWANCHFRRGRALAGMEKYKEAEKSFKRSLTYDTQIRDEVVKEVYQLRLNACLNLGFPHIEARAAADHTNSVTEAISYVVQNSADLQQNFPSDLPITSGYVSSSLPPDSSSEPSASFWSSPAKDSVASGSTLKGSSSSISDNRRTVSHIPVREAAKSNGSLIESTPDMNGSADHTAESSAAGQKGDSKSKQLSQKEILVETVIANRQLFHWCPDLQNRNEFGWFALWIGNISPVCNNDLLREMFSIFGDLVHCKVYPSDDPYNVGRDDVSYALAHYDNETSPIHAMAEYQVTCPDLLLFLSPHFSSPYSCWSFLFDCHTGQYELLCSPFP